MNDFNMPDIYFHENYAKLYEVIENGETEVFMLKTENGIIRNLFLKRKISCVEKNKLYYDIITPNGYGGPIVLQCFGDRNALIKEYETAFSKYCMGNNIVSEFIRFHPFLNNIQDFHSIYDSQIIRQTLGTNLKYDDPMSVEFSKRCRQHIRNILNKNVTFKITQKPNNLSSFLDIYNSTMNRNNASVYYYYGENYFDNCIKYFKENLLLVEAIYNNIVIAAGLYFVYNKVIHIHLSGTLNEYLKLSPAYILRYAATCWGKNNGYELIHHGGGRTNSQDDSLFVFKKQFAQTTKFDFGVGKKIWDNSVYNELCKKNNNDPNIDFFPAYRYTERYGDK